MIKLTLTEKGGEPRVLTFEKDEITIGRVSGNDIVLAKGNVSKRHSRLTVRGAQMEVADLKSTNGTYVNGRKIAGPTMLGPSDRVYVGDFLIGIEGGPDVSQTSSGARRLPVPPPPPPPPRSASSAASLPMEDDEETGGDGENEEKEVGLADRPPRSGRVAVPPPPPPPPRRPATPLGSRMLEDVLGPDGLEPPMGSPEDDESNGGAGGPLEDTGSVGLFAHTRRPDDEGDSAPSRRVATGNRPGVASPPPPSFNERAATGPTATLGESAGTVPVFEALLADPTVVQIVLIGPDAALVDRGAGLVFHPDSLGDPNAIADALWRYANTAFPPPLPDNPVVDVRLLDGTRVSVIFPPASPAGVVGSIRRAGLPEHGLFDLVPGGSKDVQTLLAALVAARRNVILTGDVAALPIALGAFAQEIPADRRVVSIGAAVRARVGWTDLVPTADLAGLVRVAAVLRPDHLVVGEIAGSEVAELVLVATRGTEGLIVALPGRTTGEALGRFTALAAPGLGSAATAASLVARAFDLILHLVATGDGGARIIEVAEPRAGGPEVLPDVALSLFNDGGKRDWGTGRLQGRGVSARLAGALATAGSPLPAALIGT